MEHTLKIFSLGGLQIHLSGQPLLRLPSRKACAILVYLSAREDPQPREILADMLWENKSQTRAMSNLRVELTTLRKHFNHFVDIQRDSVATNKNADIWFDAVAFENKLDAVDLDSAVELYRGDFLEGFHVRAAPEFEHWIVMQRERLRLSTIDVLQQLISQQMKSEEYRKGLGYARRLIELNPLMESAHRQMMRLLAMTDQREAALKQYEAFRQILLDEFGEEPSEETRQLRQKISARRIRIEIPSDRPRHNLPEKLTPFFGRESELSKIEEWLRDPTARLLTVVGTGGIGKSRLAIEAARTQLGKFKNGIFHVSLEDMENPDAITHAVAKSLKLTFSQSPEPKVQLLEFLQEKEILLVLDNFEHLLEGAALVMEIIENSPSIHVLATSREKLNLQGENIFNVQGLKVPPETVTGNARSFSSVQLFLHGGREVFSKNNQEMDSLNEIAKICRIVEGMPLAIELASPWMGVLSPDEIREELERNIDFLSIEIQGLPDRHRSMRAVFDHSWSRLKEEERDVLKKLSVFRGGFTKDAALSVTGASYRILLSLIDKSLVSRDGSDRLGLHELLRQYLDEKLNETPDEKVAARDAHRRYYTILLHHLKERIAAGHKEEALREVENLHRSWQRTFDRHFLTEMKYADVSMVWLYEFQDWHQEGLDIYTQAVEELPTLEDDAASKIIRTVLQIGMGWFTAQLGDYEKAKELITESRSQLLQLGAKYGLTMNNFQAVWLTDIRYWEYPRIEKLLHTSITLTSCETSLPFLVADSLALNKDLAIAKGDLEEGRHIINEALEIYRRIDHPRGIAAVLELLGEIAQQLGDHPEAKSLYQESLFHYETIESQISVGDILRRLGGISFEMGNIDEALTYYNQCLEKYKDSGPVHRVGLAYAKLANLYLEMSNFDKAKSMIVQSSQIFRDTDYPRYALDTIAVLAKWYNITGNLENAIGFAAIAVVNPHTRKSARVLAKSVLAEIGEIDRDVVSPLEIEDPHDLSGLFTRFLVEVEGT
jgi:predicted ATPase/DNA-binding SARP family transcriptional activator